jgi:hypothetical protein
MKKFFIFLTGFGLIASLFGFFMAYWAITRFEPRAYHYILTSLGLIAAIYGFYQAFKTIRLWKIEVGSALIAILFTSAGLISTIYGFVQAYRGMLVVTNNLVQVISTALVTVGFVGALYGFWCGYKIIIKELRRQRVPG